MHDPIGGFERIRDLYVTYLETAFRIRDEGMTAERRALLETPGTLCAEPLLEPVPRYEAADFALHDIVHDGADDPRLPGFGAKERRAFVDLALSGLFESEPAPPGSSVSRQAKFSLYEHQATMLRRGVQEGTPGVVTSGTGSGKTESFLLPVFARIAKEGVHWPAPDSGYLSQRWWHDESGRPYDSWDKVPNKPTRQNPKASPFKPHRTGERRRAAVRALILYPMNALVEDQLTRIRRALDSDEAHTVMDDHLGGNRIFFGRYTGATPVTNYHRHPRHSPDADELARRNRKLEELFEKVLDFERTQAAARKHDEALPDGEDVTRYLFPSTSGAELVNRWDMQETPPDLLITNTSMLNAMLVREVDAPIFKKTREWIEQDPDAYFYLVLDELHLQRGSAGTEVAYLLRVLLDRLGLTKPEHRHKLRILASSASLPTDEGSKERDKSLKYLWDAFGLHGMWSRSGPAPPAGPEAWADAVVSGRAKRETPRHSAPLPTQPFIELLSEYGDPEASDLAHPSLHESTWRAVAEALGTDSDGPLWSVVTESVAEAGRRLAHACWSDEDERSRATFTTWDSRNGQEPRRPPLAVSLFGGSGEDARQAIRGLLVARGVGDAAASWWPDHKGEIAQRLGGVPSFRLHTFFRAIEGLFAAPDEAGLVPEEFRSDGRTVGALGIERGTRYSEVPDGTRGNRVLELLYCECCGELFYGGRRGGSPDAVELLPFESDVDGLPDSARQLLFEDLSYDDYGIFWPSTREPAEKLKGEPRAGTWVPAVLNPSMGVVKRTLSASSGMKGRLFYRPTSEVDDRHKRSNDDAGTAVPFACPFCGMNYGRRSKEYRLSPIRSFRAGFGKTTQLLSTELFDLLRLSQSDAKLLSFSDSRQEAANAALDLESGHHSDLRLDLLIKAIRAVADGDGRSAGDLGKELEEAIAARDWGRAKELQDQIDAFAGSSGDDAIPLERVVENVDQKSHFQGPRSGRKPLRPFIAGFVNLGMHPTHDAGTRAITIPQGTTTKDYHWTELFEIGDAGADWRDHLVDQPELDRARETLVEQAQRLLSDALFSKNYFALEETGIGYPCVLGVAPSERKELDAFLRVLSDAYRLRDDPWADKGSQQKDPLKEWTQGADVNKQNRVRRFANRLWNEDEVNVQLDRVLSRLKASGHPSGIIFTSNLGVRLVGEGAPYWRCGNCGRVHLHRGTGVCTRCFKPLPQDASGSARELRHFMTERVEREAPPFRLRCEELTGQTQDPADRQRRFRGIVLDDVPSDSDVPPHVSGPLLRAASVVDLLTVTTTMEVGVDVGSLQATMQANMPPQRFNYQQRVGRAGRRRQAYSIVLTVCRNKSHDLYYFRNTEAITGDAPPPPFLSKSLVDPALRFLRKLWLWKAFDLVREECGQAGEDFPGDSLVPPDIHGEFVPSTEFFSEDPVWRERLASALERTESYGNHLASVLTSCSPLDGELHLNEDVLLEEMEEARRLEAMSPGLGQTLAEAGLLPMLGMPTRVRNLYYDYDVQDGYPPRVEWKTVDRDLDVAIFEFAPGSVIVNDKKQLQCWGFTGPLPLRPRSVQVPSGRKRLMLIPHDDAFGPPFWLVDCTHCGSWKRLPEAPDPMDPGKCETCGYLLNSAAAMECRVPTGFRTDLQPRPYDPSLRSPRRSGFGITAEGHRIPFDESQEGNVLTAYRERSRTYRINSGERNEGYAVKQYRDGRKGPFWRRSRLPIAKQVFSGDHEWFRERYESEPDGLESEALHLAAPKTTDALFLAPRSVSPYLDLLPRTSDGRSNTPARAAAISAAYILTYRASRDMDVDPDELEVVPPRVVRLPSGGDLLPVIQITDSLVNGAGYCRQLSESDGEDHPFVVRLIDSVIHDRGHAPLKDFLQRDAEVDHPKVCDQSCYRCLQRYGNQSYHGLLDWRLGLAYLTAIFDPDYACGADGSSTAQDPAMFDWHELARRYAEDVIVFEGRDPQEAVRMFGSLTAFQLTEGGPWTPIVHPLWNVNDEALDSRHVLKQAVDEIERAGCRWTMPVNTFDLSRRAVAVREELLHNRS